MLYKEDWEETKRRLKDWWNGEADSPIVQVTALRSGLKLSEQDYYWEWGFAKDPENPDKTIESFERWASKIYFGGEAYPNLWVSLGPGILGAYLGAEPKFECDTMWFGAQWSKKYIKDWEELLNIEFDEDNRWWKITKEITRRAAEAGKDKFIVGITDLGGITDVLASSRSPEKLIVDMYKNKEKVKIVSEKILEIWHKCYDALLNIINEHIEGSSAWMNIWSPKKWYPIQCDFAAMLSPKLFDELVLPYLKEQCKRLNDVIYHLDGPGELPHVESLLNIEELKGIQWVPGASEDSQGNHCGSRKWYPLYRKILSRGKLLVLYRKGCPENP